MTSHPSQRPREGELEIERERLMALFLGAGGIRIWNGDGGSRNDDGDGDYIEQ